MALSTQEQSAGDHIESKQHNKQEGSEVAAKEF